MNAKLLAKRSAPYRYLTPTIILMTVFLVIPICMVVYFSFLDKAVVSKKVCSIYRLCNVIAFLYFICSIYDFIFA